MKNRKIYVVVDGQFGSTGKGLLSGFLAKTKNIDTICTAWAANAGHTFIDENGKKYVHTMLANGVVGSNVKRVLLGAGSLINPDALEKEYNSCINELDEVILAIHPNAAIIQQRHVDEESESMTKIGSTKKGCGAAAIQRIRRNPDDMNIAKVSDHPFVKSHVVTENEYQKLLNGSKNVLIEGAQGYSLSMYHGQYPYTTSRDVSTHQLLADCCIPWNFGHVEVYGCYRTYPIRVANRFDVSGKQVGFSGGCYPDQEEINWHDLGIEPELTTVTRLPRRVFTFSKLQFCESIRMMGVNNVFLNFVNYLPNKSAVVDFVYDLEFRSGVSVDLVGVGSKVNDIMNLQSFIESNFDPLVFNMGNNNVQGQVD